MLDVFLLFYKQNGLIVATCNNYTTNTKNAIIKPIPHINKLYNQVTQNKKINTENKVMKKKNSYQT